MKLFRLSGACFLAMAFLAAALLPTAVNAQKRADCGWMYGIDDQNNIIEYNPEVKVVRTVLNTTLPRTGTGNGPCNSFAFDSVRARMFFIYVSTSTGIAAANGLYYWNQGSPSVAKIAELSELFLTDASQNPSNAVFANDNFYFIKWAENTLVTCPITRDSWLQPEDHYAACWYR